MKRQLNKILVLVYLLSSIFVSFIPNTMEAFMYYKPSFLVANILQIISFTNFLWLILALLYDSKMAKCNAFYIALPSTIFKFIFIKDYLSFYEVNYFHLFALLFNLILEIILSIYLYFKLEDKKYNFKYLLYQLIILILFIPQNAFNPLAIKLAKNSFFNFTNFSLWHFMFLFLFILSAIILYLFLKNKNKRQIQIVLLSLSLIILFNLLNRFSYTALYNYQETTGIYGAIPLYICSFGSVLLPIAIYSNNKKFMSILFLINCPGAIIVLVNPTTGIVDIFTYNVLHFFYIHILLFITTLMLPIYLDAKPSKGTVLNAGIALLIYFIIVSLINAVVYCYTNYDANFSFVTTSPIKVGIEKYLQFHLFGLTYSILYLLILWLVQYGLATITYYIYKIIYKIKFKNIVLTKDQ